MKRLKKENEWISTVQAFVLIPISGFAMDVYVPSFPEMVRDLNTTVSNVQFTMTIFLISYGVSQLFIGSLIDSYGRYRLNLIALAIFTASNFVIVATKSIELIFVMRAVQGLVISIIMVSKRSFFIDVYTGDKQRHYTSLLSIVWSAAPVLAPFFGGYLQQNFGWTANFYFLGGYGLVMLIMELIFSGETIKEYKSFDFKSVLGVYKRIFKAQDFTLGIWVLGLSYSMAILFGMSAPFIIEHTFHLSAVVTGYCALLSGTALMLGGILGKFLIKKPFYKKLSLANIGQAIIAIIMFLCAGWYANLVTLMVFVVLIHFLMGFIYNIYFTYCLTRFPADAGIAGGMTSGGAYIVTSAASYTIASFVHVDGQQALAISYFILIVAITLVLLLVKLNLKKFVLAG